MTQPQSKILEWKGDVRQWLAEVVQYQHRTGFDLRTAAAQMKQHFPSTPVVTFVGQQVYVGASKWAVKLVLREAATSLGIVIDDETLDFISGLAAESLIAAA